MLFRTYRSLSSVILWTFTPMIIIFVSITGMVSYFIASTQMEQAVLTSLRDTVSQSKGIINEQLTDAVSDLLMLLNNADLVDIMNKLENPNYELTPFDYVALAKNIDRTYSNRYSMVDSILFYLNDGRVSFLKKDYSTTPLVFSFSSYLRQFGPNTNRINWRNLHDNDLFQSVYGSTKVASLFRLIGDEHSKLQGILLFHLRESFFREVLTSPEISENGFMLLTSQDGLISFKNIGNIFEQDKKQLMNDLLKQSQEEGTYKYRDHNGKNWIVSFNTIRINKWKIAAVIPEEDVLSKIQYIKYFSISVIFIVVATAIVISGLLARWITRPITRFLRQLKKARNGEHQLLLDGRSTSEVGELGAIMSEMMRQINDLVLMVKSEQEQKRHAEFAALQSQINPHFLYNTLYSIKQLTDMGETQNISRMVTALASFFRLSLSKGKEITRIGDEMEHVKSYLYIMGMRYGTQFSYDVVIPESMHEYKTIKLILQPLVENAIYHGVKVKSEKCHIEVSGFADDEDCWFFVKDTGAGIPEEKLTEINRILSDGSYDSSSMGIGILNVHHRLQLHYGSSYGLTYESEPGAGTVVTVRIKKTE